MRGPPGGRLERASGTFSGVSHGVKCAKRWSTGARGPPLRMAQHSVGGRAIDASRPVCFQDAPASLLPEELRAGNPAASGAS